MTENRVAVTLNLTTDEVSEVLIPRLKTILGRLQGADGALECAIDWFKENEDIKSIISELDEIRQRLYHIDNDLDEVHQLFMGLLQVELNEVLTPDKFPLRKLAENTTNKDFNEEETISDESIESSDPV